MAELLPLKVYPALSSVLQVLQEPLSFLTVLAILEERYFLSLYMLDTN